MWNNQIQEADLHSIWPGLVNISQWHEKQSEIIQKQNGKVVTPNEITSVGSGSEHNKKKQADVCLLTAVHIVAREGVLPKEMNLNKVSPLA